MGQQGVAEWGGRPVEFNQQQRTELLGIIRKKDDAKAREFLAFIESSVPSYRSFRRAMQNPPESPKAARALLDRLAKKSENLIEELRRLSMDHSEKAILEGCSNISMDHSFLYELPDLLLQLQIVASGATRLIRSRGKGRHPKYSEHWFVREIWLAYARIYGRRPATSKGTQFVRFIRKVFKIISPDNPWLQGDISHRVTSAVKDLKANN